MHGVVCVFLFFGDSAGVPNFGLEGPRQGLGLKGGLLAVEYDAVLTCIGDAGVDPVPPAMLWDLDHTTSTAACVDNAVPTDGRLLPQLIASAPRACVPPIPNGMLAYDDVLACIGAAGVGGCLIMLWDRGHTSSTAACVDNAVAYGRLPPQLGLSTSCMRRSPWGGCYQHMHAMNASVVIGSAVMVA